MASRRRRRSAARTSRAPEPQEPEELVPELEPWDEAEEGPVRVSLVETPEEDVDLRLDVEVPEMPKAQVLDALREPLRRVLAEQGERLRWRRVRVLFGGEALIPGAAKDALAEQLGGMRPRAVVMERGFGDELVLENEPPQARVDTEEEGAILRVSIDTADLEEVDLAEALRKPLADLVPRARGKTVRIRATGAAAGSDALEGLLSGCEFAAAATRVELVVGGESPRVLRDAALEALVEVVSSSENRLELRVREVASPATLRDALALARRHRAGGWRAAELEVTLPAAATRDLLDVLEPFAEGIGATTFRVADPEGTDLVLPRALSRGERAGETVLLEARSAGRDDAALRRALERELAPLADTVRGRPVVVDWGEDADIDPSLAEPFVAVQPSRLAWTFAGGKREPILPPPFTVRGEGETVELVLDTEAAPPKELAFALKRRLLAALPAGARRVRVLVEGRGAPTRGLVRALVESARKADVETLSIVDSGVEDVLLPPALDADGERMVARRGGRDDAALARAFARELEEVAVEGADLRVAGDAAEPLVDALVARGAARVVLETQDAVVQVWPRLFGTPVREGEEALVVAAPSADEATTAAQLDRELPAVHEGLGDLSGVRVTLRWPGAAVPPRGPAAAAVESFVAAGAAEVWLDGGSGPRRLHPAPPVVQVLGRRDVGDYPLTMLGVETSAGAERVAAALADVVSGIENRRVLLVFTREGREVAARDEHPVVRAARGALEASAAAILVLRGPRAGHGPHFEVVASKIESLGVGKRFADPRTRAAPGRPG